MGRDSIRGLWRRYSERGLGPESEGTKSEWLRKFQIQKLKRASSFDFWFLDFFRHLNFDFPESNPAGVVPARLQTSDGATEVTATVTLSLPCKR
jgi:hypothetical protein